MRCHLLIAPVLLMVAGSAAGGPAPPLKRLDRMLLQSHGLAWLDITPDDPRRKTALWEQWPGRCEICHRYEQALKERYYRLIEERARDPRTGIFCLPDGMKGNEEMVRFIRERFGDRCAVCRLDGDKAKMRQVLGDAFMSGLEEDRRRAEAARGPNLSEGEIGAWERSKAWATDLRMQLEAQGYTFDPAKAKFVAFGEDWCGCAATYPIHMGRALGLARPIERRFELIHPDCSPLLLGSTTVARNLELGGIRLFLFRSAEGRYLAQYWEGMHALWEKPHAVEVSFPPGSARLVDTSGKPRGEAGGTIRMSVGCGGHTPHRSDLVQAEPGLSLARFRRALLAGKVIETE